MSKVAEPKSEASKFQPEKEGYWAALVDKPRESPFKEESFTVLWLKGYDEAVVDFTSI